jgi:hypothetical protein
MRVRQICLFIISYERPPSLQHLNGLPIPRTCTPTCRLRTKGVGSDFFYERKIFGLLRATTVLVLGYFSVNGCRNGWRGANRVCQTSSVVFVFSALLACAQPGQAYSTLTHEQLIDLSWKSTIVPILLDRFPSMTDRQLMSAHSYAYGGCVIQDLGYYPFSETFFSELTHYVRSGDFIRSLFRNAQTADELAFAIGALTHYIGDSVGHSRATNPSVAISFPKLRAKYGASVSFAQDKNAHGRVEFAFDINQITKRRLAPSSYLRHIGLRVPRNQLMTAFYETYGFRIGEILGLFRTAVRTYRFGARSFMPRIAYAEALLHRNSFPGDTPGPQFEIYERRIAELAQEEQWNRYRRGPRIGTYLLAGLIFILPKVGVISQLAIKGPTADTEQLYVESVNLSTAALRRALAPLLASQNDSTKPPATRDGRPSAEELLPDRDLDTGSRVTPGSYRLTDQTYAKLLARVTKDRTRPIPAGLKEDILRYYADSHTPISTKKDQKKWAEVQMHLKLLPSLPTREELE